MKEKSRYLCIDPDSKEESLKKTETMKRPENSAPKSDSEDNEIVEYTDGFYSSDTSIESP